MKTQQILETKQQTNHNEIAQKKEKLEEYNQIKNNLFKENPQDNSVSGILHSEARQCNQTLLKDYSPLKQTEKMVNSEPNHPFTDLYSQKSLNQIQASNKRFTNKTFTPYKEKLNVYTQNSKFSEAQNEQKQKPIIKEQTAKQVLIELQEALHKKSIEKKELNLHKSLDMKSRVVKLNPQKIKQKKDKKIKQAEQKLKVNIQFLQRLKLRPKYEKPSFKQFRNYSENTLKQIKSIKLKSITSMKLKSINKIYFESIEMGSVSAIRYSTDRKELFRNQNTERNLQGMNILIQSPMKLPPIQNNRCVKPKPYSIYNIHQKSNEMFTNLPMMNFG